ncbi:2-hydroxyacid dehydrogenase [Agaribacter flavus]|uniref:2-hydroxyacid dehydrogenase n=1 Tax=Agaribacter flavus TaxID=1902781 RepID=A0ABV7FW96_9ALTE
MPNSHIEALLARLATTSDMDVTTYRAISELLDKARPKAKETSQQVPYEIAFFDAKPYDKKAFESQNDGRFVFRYIDAQLNKHTAALARGCTAVCVFVNDECDQAVIGELARLGVQCVALRCAGFNNVDLVACKALDIQVVRVPAYSPHAVAEHTVALMLMLNRQLHRAYMRNRSGQFLLDGLVGFDMFNKKVGVVGTGKIGRCVIEILLGFGCKILAFDPKPSEQFRNQASVQYTSFESVIAESDILTLHSPLTPETQHLIDDVSIAKMKQGVMIINTSRGGLVDSKALIKGLKTGHIAFAGLDVYEEEGGIFFNDMSNQIMDDDVLARLMTFNNVVITSHQAFLTHEALANIASTTLLNLDEFFLGKRGLHLTNVVS